MSEDSKFFRDSLGLFATGVCVITARPKSHEPFGLTINSFSSLSLQPPLILWSLQLSSETLPAFRDSDEFAVNILNSGQISIANQYARKGNHNLLAEHISTSAGGHPVIAGSLASFVCDIHTEFDGGDHIILVGKVKETLRSENGEPLLFYRSKYCGLVADALLTS